MKDIFMFIISIAMLAIFILNTMGCASARHTVTSRTDTLFVERKVERQLVIHDTIESISKVVEYIADTATNKWTPIKMVVAKRVQRESQECKRDEELFEERQLKSKIEVEDKDSKTKIGKWFLAGFVVAIFIILFIRIKLFL